MLVWRSKKKYKSPYTGKEVDAAVGKADTIPDTSVADAGKVLGVTPEGKIGLIENGGGGGSNVAIANYSLQQDNQNVKAAPPEPSVSYICDKTYAQIVALLDAGTPVVACFRASNNETYYGFISHLSSGVALTAIAWGRWTGGNIKCKLFTHGSNESIGITGYDISAYAE